MKEFYISLLIIFMLFGCSEEKPSIVWSDNFNNTSDLDNSKWSVIVGNGCPELCGFGNNELQYYTKHKENIWIENGKLYIQATKDTIGDQGFKSAKIITKNKGDWRYGKIEVRAKLPKGRGTWPAIWMLPTIDGEISWPRDGEIDIMEHVGYNPEWVYGTVHTELYNGLIGTQISDSVLVENMYDEFHEYSISWDERNIQWFVDDVKFHEISRDQMNESWPFDKPFHLIINLAVGGTWAGLHGVDDNIWPQQLVIDYVNIYQ